MSWRLSLFDPAHENHGISGSPDQCLGSPGLYLDGLITCGDSADMALCYKCYRKGSTLLLDHCAMLRHFAPRSGTRKGFLRPGCLAEGCQPTVRTHSWTVRTHNWRNSMGKPKKEDPDDIWWFWAFPWPAKVIWCMYRRCCLLCKRSRYGKDLLTSCPSSK